MASIEFSLNHVRAGETPRICEAFPIGQELLAAAADIKRASAQSDFDLVMDKRITEFKFINWQGGSKAVRKKTLFEDYVKLARATLQRRDTCIC